MMKMVFLKNGVNQIDVSSLVLYTTDLSDEEKTALFSLMPYFNVIDDLNDYLYDIKNSIIVIFPKHFNNDYFNDNNLDKYLDKYLLLTADDNKEDLSNILDICKLKHILIYVKDFKDGRLFSLIHQIRYLNKEAFILIGGLFGIDQSGYFIKSGANGFIVNDDSIITLIQTLNHLKTAKNNKSVNDLPIFR